MNLHEMEARIENVCKEYQLDFPELLKELHKGHIREYILIRREYIDNIVFSENKNGIMAKKQVIDIQKKPYAIDEVLKQISECTYLVQVLSKNCIAGELNSMVFCRLLLIVMIDVNQAIDCLLRIIRE